MTGAPLPDGRRHRRPGRVTPKSGDGQGLLHDRCAGRQRAPRRRGRRRRRRRAAARARLSARPRSACWPRSAWRPSPSRGGRGWRSSPPAASWWPPASRSGPGRSATRTRSPPTARCWPRAASRSCSASPATTATRRAGSSRAPSKKTSSSPRRRLGRRVRLRQGGAGGTRRRAPLLARAHQAGQADRLRDARRTLVFGVPGQPRRRDGELRALHAAGAAGACRAAATSGGRTSWRRAAEPVKRDEGPRRGAALPAGAATAAAGASRRPARRARGSCARWRSPTGSPSFRPGIPAATAGERLMVMLLDGREGRAAAVPLSRLEPTRHAPDARPYSSAKRSRSSNEPPPHTTRRRLAL